jgi:hypothetical protein
MNNRRGRRVSAERCICLLPDFDFRRLNIRRDKLSINQVLHADRFRQDPSLDRHVVNGLEVFIRWRQHPVAHAIGWLR